MTPRRALIAVLTSVLALTACNSDPSTVASPPQTAGDIQRGETLFTNNCARCHGEAAVGTENGPSFLSDIYVASHHGDVAFQLATQRGVQSHHWDFGDMPPIEGVTPDEVTDIVAYVRALQREAGLPE